MLIIILHIYTHICPYIYRGVARTFWRKRRYHIYKVIYIYIYIYIIEVSHEHWGVPNHRQIDCLFNNMPRHTTQKIPNPLTTGREIPLQWSCYKETISIQNLIPVSKEAISSPLTCRWYLHTYPQCLRIRNIIWYWSCHRLKILTHTLRSNLNYPDPRLYVIVSLTRTWLSRFEFGQTNTIVNIIALFNGPIC